LGRFSLFSFGPILSLILLVLFLWPGVWGRLTGRGDPSGSVSSAALLETAAAD
jgi:hypothetical protein